MLCQFIYRQQICQRSQLANLPIQQIHKTAQFFHPVDGFRVVEKIGVSGLGHRRSFGGIRPQISHPRFLELENPLLTAGRPVFCKNKGFCRKNTCPEPSGSCPEAWGSCPEAWDNCPECRDGCPEPRGNCPKVRGNCPKAWGSRPETWDSCLWTWDNCPESRDNCPERRNDCPKVPHGCPPTAAGGLDSAIVRAIKPCVC